MANAEEMERKKLIPIWIKVFGWFFILMGCAAVILPAIFMLIQLNEPATFMVFGLTFSGSPFHPLALFIEGIYIALGICAYGLLFGKTWGVKACLIMCYLSIALCVATMLYSIVARGVLLINFELIALIPYLRWLKKQEEPNLSNAIA